jgi:hypothetical protein
MYVANARFIFSVSDIETPVASILNPPVTANGTSKSLHAHGETADVVADFIGGSAIAHAMMYDQADGFQAGPLVDARQTLWCGQLNVGSRFRPKT